MDKKDEIYSYHCFMFPFRFDYINSNSIDTDKHSFYKKQNFYDRVKIDKDFHDRLQKKGWIYKKFNISQSVTNYNEYSYYHDFVRDAIYNLNDFDKNATSYYFEKYIGKDATYSIELNSNKTYTLNLTHISLRVFDTGIAILVFEMYNKNYPYTQAILDINDFGRRVYPQFLDMYDEKNLLDAPRETFLPKELTVKYQNREIKEDFEDSYCSIPNGIKISKIILEVLDTDIFSTEFKSNKYLIQPVIDDRMFVICWYGESEFAKQIRDEGYFTLDNWYRFVFVDNGSKTVASNKMQKKLIDEVTYDRWMNNGTLYGISRYSMVSLTDRSWFATNILRVHIETIYYQMAILLLAQRASILRFSDEVSALSDIDEKDDKEVAKKISILYKAYIRFVNKLYFREVTPQEQGIEMYEIAQNVMNIKRDIKDLDNEIAELHSYMNMIEEKSRNDRLEVISKIGAIFLPPTLLAGMFGMNMINFSQNPLFAFIAVILIFLSSIISYGLLEGVTIKDILKSSILKRYIVLGAVIYLPIIFYIIVSIFLKGCN